MNIFVFSRHFFTPEKYKKNCSNFAENQNNYEYESKNGDLILFFDGKNNFFYLSIFYVVIKTLNSSQKIICMHCFWRPPSPSWWTSTWRTSCGSGRSSTSGRSWRTVRRRRSWPIRADTASTSGSWRSRPGEEAQTIFLKFWGPKNFLKFWGPNIFFTQTIFFEILRPKQFFLKFWACTILSVGVLGQKKTLNLDFFD